MTPGKSHNEWYHYYCLNFYVFNIHFSPRAIPAKLWTATLLTIKIDLNGVLKLLSNLKPDKAAGPDSIKPVVLKQLKIEIAPVLCLLFEKTLQTGQLPSDWKNAQVCSLFKKGDKTEPSYYRPISITCILCKVMEHITASNLSTHLSKHNILYELQHGFREKRSCKTQLIQLAAAIFGKANRFNTFGF